MKANEKLIRSCCEGISFISDIQKNLPKDNTIVDISNVFKALSDPTRVKILFALLELLVLLVMLKFFF